MTISRILVLLAVLTAAVGPVSAVTFQETKLGPMPPANINSEDDLKFMAPQIAEMEAMGFAIEALSCITDRQGFHIAAVVPTKDGKVCAWLDGRKGPAYDQIRHATRGAYSAREFRFSPDGRRLAYTARKGSKWMMVVDGQEGATYDSLREAYFSMDGKRVAYVAFRDNKSILVIDGKESPPYAEIAMHLPYVVSDTPFRKVDDTYCPVRFASNGRTAYIASNGRNQYFAIIDGKPGPIYEHVGSIEFSPDGSRVAYTARKNEKEFVVLDGKPGPKYDGVEAALVFSPDGKRMAYVGTNYDANSDPIQMLVVDGKEIARYRVIEDASIMFSPDGKHLTYTASADGEKYFVVLDGEAGPKYDEIGGFGGRVYATFTPAGKLVYRATRGEKRFMVVDGVESPAFDDVSDVPVYSPDGAHYAYHARENDHSVVVCDGVKGKTYFNVYEESIAFTSDGKLVYQASSDTGDTVTVVGAEERPGIYHPVVSADGKHPAFSRDKQADDMNNKVVVFGDAESGRFMTLLKKHFLPDGTLEFLAVRDESGERGLSYQLYRVTAK